MPSPQATPKTFELLTLCARTKLKPIHVHRINELVSKGIQWGILIKLAEQQGMLPLLSKNLIEVCNESVPPALFKYLSLKSFTSSMHNLFLTQELSRLVSMFEQHGIPVLTIKGPALAKIAYGDINLRSYIDLDLLIRKKDFSTVTFITD